MFFDAQANVSAIVCTCTSIMGNRSDCVQARSAIAITLLFYQGLILLRAACTSFFVVADTLALLIEMS